MGDHKTLEELRAKIMASMGKGGGEGSQEARRQPAGAAPPTGPGQQDSYKRQRSTRGTEGHGYPPGKRPRGPGDDRYAGGNGERQMNQRDRNGYNSQRGERQPRLQGMDRYRNRRRDDSSYGSDQQQNRGDNRYGSDQHHHHQQQQQQPGRDNRYNRYNNQPSRYSTQQDSTKTHGNSANYNDYKHTNNRRDNRRENKREMHAFQQVHLYKNMTHSRLNNTICIHDAEFGNDKNTQQDFSRLIDKFCKGLGINAELSMFSYTGTTGTVVMEFSSAECATIVFACKSFLANKTSLKDANWSRPNGYILQKDSMTQACNANTVAIENVSLEVEEDSEKLMESATEYIKKLGVPTASLTVLPVLFKENEETKEFTGCILLSSATPITAFTNSGPQGIKWFRPNMSKGQVQETKWFIFNNFPKKAAENFIPPSRILLLSNCVNPLELTNDASLAGDVEECLTKTLPNVESVKMRRPVPDYKLTFQYLKDQVGSIYAKFQDTDSAKRAVETFTQRKFNGRQVICAYIDEQDYTDIISNW